MFEELDEIDYGRYSTEETTCAMTDLRQVFFIALGAVTAALALGMWMVKKIL